MLDKLIRGNRTSGHRLRDEKGNRVSLRRALFNGPYCIGTGLLRIATGVLPKRPWISCDAIRILRRHLSKQSRVLEFGSGMSTIWYASHAGQVFSVEDNPEWYAKVSAMLTANRKANVAYRLTTDEQEYATFCADDPDGFDLVMVDGTWRSRCMENAVKLVRPGGILYLDNADKHSTAAGGDTRGAEQLALEFAKANGAEVTYLTDFAPAQLFVQQGMCVRLLGHGTPSSDQAGKPFHAKTSDTSAIAVAVSS
jgi:SAM-dependent methyltransferase